MNTIPHPTEARAPVMRVARGQPVYFEGDHALALFRLRTGLARIVRLSPGGRTITVRHLLPGDYFGEEVLRGPSAAHRDGEVQALTRLELEALPTERVTGGLLEGVVRNLSVQLERTQRFHEHLQLGDLPERLARYLLELHASPLGERDAADRPLVRVSHEVLSQGVSATRESTSKTLVVMAHDGLLETGYRRVSLLDVPRLHALAKESLS